MLTIIYTNKHTQKNHKINLNRLFASLLILTLIITCIGLYVDFVRFPNKYITTWKYQLKNEIESGNLQAINYYNKYYISKGVYLYGEDAEPESDFLNLATVTSYETTEQGVLLHTEDGNGYFVEK
jgi:hypothetical protein